MRLNVQSDYALRLLMHLAVNRNALVTIAEVAERYRISRNHLMKVVRQGCQYFSTMFPIFWLANNSPSMNNNCIGSQYSHFLKSIFFVRRTNSL